MCTCTCERVRESGGGQRGRGGGRLAERERTSGVRREESGREVQRTHSIYRESILSTEHTFYLQRTHSIYREHILSTEHTFYLQRTQSSKHTSLNWPS